jgi:integrase/recombinase XerD
MDNSQPGPAVSGVVVGTSHVQRLAVAAYLARFKGQSRIHTESDLRGYLTWCKSRGLDPLATTRPHIELYVRWLQEVRRYRPSTVSRRVSVVAGFYRTCDRRRARGGGGVTAAHRFGTPSSGPTAAGWRGG